MNAELRHVIAVVDDDPRILESLQDLLESAGYEVRVYATGAALLSAGIEHVDALVTDVGLLMLLEKLPPAERAVYLLREAFGYDYRQIARVLRVTEVNSRQLATRARKHLLEASRVSVARSHLARFCEAFAQATKHGAMARLEAFLQADILRTQ